MVISKLLEHAEAAQSGLAFTPAVDWRHELLQPQWSWLAQRYDAETELTQLHIARRLDLRTQIGALSLARHLAEQDLTDIIRTRCANTAAIDDASNQALEAARQRVVEAQTGLFTTSSEITAIEGILYWNNTPSGPYLYMIEQSEAALIRDRQDVGEPTPIERTAA